MDQFNVPRPDGPAGSAPAFVPPPSASVAAALPAAAAGIPTTWIIVGVVVGVVALACLCAAAIYVFLPFLMDSSGSGTSGSLAPAGVRALLAAR